MCEYLVSSILKITIRVSIFILLRPSIATVMAILRLPIRLRSIVRIAILLVWLIRWPGSRGIDWWCVCIVRWPIQSGVMWIELFVGAWIVRQVLGIHR